MTDKELDKLADIIVEKIFKKQKEYDEEFKKDIQHMMDENPGLEFGTTTTEDLILDELNDLQIRLKQLEDKEDYEAAAIVANKIKHLKNKYKL
ncbi:MAG: hypothetical protein GY787_01820 [Alteromonadales bacterium]|jgi:protein-arginine kinase activator protein McsA|nr:hypothetical protein [Alteromonadales bacterium]